LNDSMDMFNEYYKNTPANAVVPDYASMEMSGGYGAPEPKDAERKKYDIPLFIDDFPPNPFEASDKKRMPAAPDMPEDPASYSGVMAYGEDKDGKRVCPCSLKKTPCMGTDTRLMPKFPEKTPPVMAYIPYQQMGGIYNEEKGLEAGTMFPELNQPFYGRKGCR